jgi:hypothetical protein
MPVYSIVCLFVAAMCLWGLSGHVWALIGAVVLAPAVLATWCTDALVGILRDVCTRP